MIRDVFDCVMATFKSLGQMRGPCQDLSTSAKPKAQARAPKQAMGKKKKDPFAEMGKSGEGRRVLSEYPIHIRPGTAHCTPRVIVDIDRRAGRVQGGGCRGEQ